MRRRSFVRLAVLGAFAVPTLGCALVFEGGGKNPEDRDYERILWGYVILDVLLTGFIGLIIDFATGAIYAEKDRPMTSSARPVRVCSQTTVAMVEAGASRQAASYLRHHLPKCRECSRAFRTLDRAPEVELDRLLATRGDVLDEHVEIELAPA
jgi:hypothetical protein